MWLKLNNFSILSIYAFTPDFLYVGTGDGLYSLSIKSENEYSFNKVEYKGITNPSNFERVYSIAHWKDRKFFLATKAGVLFFDPSGANEADNSYYTAGTLNFGEGGVDDAEDADIIIHEYGHASRISKFPGEGEAAVNFLYIIKN